MLRRRFATGALAALLLPASAEAQVFNLPQQCTSGATGSEDEEDPVVLISLGTGQKNFRGFELSSASRNRWYIKIAPAQAQQYNVFVTWTPFLTSDMTINLNNNRPSVSYTLPEAGVTGGRRMTIWRTYTLTINDASGKQVVPNAYVDFVPAFDGSSPYTMQANAQGVIVLNCVQQVSSGYHITVYDQTHKYLYDSTFGSTGLTASARGDAGGSTRAVSEASQ